MIEGVTTTISSNQQPRLQNPTPQRDRRIMRRIEVRERTGEGGGGAKKRKKPHKSYTRDVTKAGAYDPGGSSFQNRLLMSHEFPLFFLVCMCMAP